MIGLRACAGVVAAALTFFACLTAAAETPVERGAYLVETIAACGNCHSPRGAEGAPIPGLELSGAFVVELDEFTAVAPNITPDVESGIGSWSDDEIVRAIREGVRPDGRVLGPPMPFEMYRDMSDSDVRAIVAYLRTVKPVSNTIARSEYRMPLPPAWGPPVTSVPDVDRSDRIAYGAYLAGPVGHCIECHTPFGDTPGHRDYAHNLGAGGFEIPGPWGIAVSKNLTPDPESGIGAYSDEEIKSIIRTGVRPDGSEMTPPMAYAWYSKIKEEDLDAIVAYLRTLKPIRNEY